MQNALVQLRHQIANKTLEPDLLDSPSRESFLQWILENLKDYEPVQKVINATGVVVHTNLGRAPLPKDLFENLLPRLCSYSNLEFELETGKRGSRDSVLRNLLRNLSGAEEAMVVNNKTKHFAYNSIFVRKSNPNESQTYFPIVPETVPEAHKAATGENA